MPGTPNMRPNLTECEKKFHRLCLKGTEEKALELSEGRGEIYKGLVHNVFVDTLSRAYPLSKLALSTVASPYEGPNAWEYIVRCFLEEAESEYPELWKMPKAFLRFCRESSIGSEVEAPWLDDLLSFEWAEIEVFMMRDDAPFELLLCLTYPVYRTSVHSHDCKPGTYYLKLTRNPETLFVECTEMSPEAAIHFSLEGASQNQ